MATDVHQRLTFTELGQFAADLADAPERWQRPVRRPDGGRAYELIWEDPDVNAWLIYWSEDNDTGFHDHDESAAAILVIDGHLREERLRLGRAPQARVIGPGATFFVPPTAIHRVLHTGTSPALSIHVYSPPLRRMGAYRIGPDGELERTAQSYEEELRAAARLVGSSRT